MSLVENTRKMLAQSYMLGIVFDQIAEIIGKLAKIYINELRRVKTTKYGDGLGSEFIMKM